MHQNHFGVQPQGLPCIFLDVLELCGLGFRVEDLMATFGVLYGGLQVMKACMSFGVVRGGVHGGGF